MNKERVMYLLERFKQNHGPEASPKQPFWAEDFEELKDETEAALYAPQDRRDKTKDEGYNEGYDEGYSRGYDLGNEDASYGN